ncbi:MAG: hypothetical protein KDD44_07255 [Bdellovibrionales bacterium]|nr:hypothetical protein [Bdellovibrionales bacterium]
MNIAIVAGALPVLLLAIIAAAEITRLPLVKQQMLSAISSGEQWMVGSDSGTTRTGTSMNWCPLFGSELMAAYSDPPCPQWKACSVGEACSKSDFADTSFAGTVADNIAKRIQDDLTGGSGVYGHAKADVGIQVDIVNLLVARAGNPLDGAVIGHEVVASSDVMYRGIVSAAADDLMSQLFLNDNVTSAVPRLTTKGASSTPQYFHAPLAIIWVAVRVHHAFPLPTALRFGASGYTSSASTSTLTATVIRPFPRIFRASGSIKDGG